ncbi:ATP-binding protein [Botryobacter ruber]|uniref:ATP-binding protein n=1 Tax=Botryobacter ruber TaxID=2171629 RepID=UPI000E0B73EC|nr:ATP-binding protein [Botryobacter ruber]
MDGKQHQRFLLTDKSFANIIKRDITRLAESEGFSPADVGKINIIVSEMVSNLLKHTPQGGELLVKPIENHGLEIICLDSGPGMSDPVRMLQDGTSSVGTAGEGLGAIKRQSNEFDLFSCPGCGTVILSRVYKAQKEASPARSRFQVSSLMVPKPNEQICGDGFGLVEKGNDCYLIVLDGLGHGVNAHDASRQAVELFEKRFYNDPVLSLRQIHEAIRRTRGAVGTIVHLSASRKKAVYCGVGNIAGRIFMLDGAFISNSSSRTVISYNGILGHNIPATFSAQQADWNNASLLILHSDGIKSRWDLSRYPNLHRHDTSVIAAILYRDFSRQTDDILVVVARTVA